MLYLFCSVQFASTSTCQLPACLIRTDGCSIVTHEFVNTIYQCASKSNFFKIFRLQKMACSSETKRKNFFFRREIFFLFFLHWPTVILACSGALQPYWKYLRIASENGQKSRIYYVKGAKTSPSLTVLIQVSDWAEIWYIASIYIYV